MIMPLQFAPFIASTFIFLGIAGAFALFMIFYLLFSAAIIYHLYAFRAPGQTAPWIVTSLFGIASAILCLWGLFFLIDLNAHLQ